MDTHRGVEVVIKVVEVAIKEIKGGTKDTSQFLLDHGSRWTGTVTRGC